MGQDPERSAGPQPAGRNAGDSCRGEGAVIIGCESRGASNARAKRELGWTLRYPGWRDGFAATYTSTIPAPGTTPHALTPIAPHREETISEAALPGIDDAALPVLFKKSDQGLRRPGGRIREARHPGDHGAAPARPPRPQQGLRLNRKEAHVERSLDPGSEYTDLCERLQPMRAQPTREPGAPWRGTARGRVRRPPRRPWPWPDRDRPPRAAARSLRTRRAGP